ncbi:MAG: EcsC family protein [Pirellulales bacterium]
MADAQSSGGLSAGELRLLAEAADYLENPSLLMQLANAVGKPLEFVVRAVEKVAPGRVDEAVGAALRTAVNVAVRTIPTDAAGAKPVTEVPEDLRKVGALPGFLHKLSVAVTGTAGGLFGVAGLAVELPVTTTLMFRSIASIAREFGEDLDDAEVRLQCLTVFSLGGPGEAGEAMDSAYLSARWGVQEMVTHAARAVAGMTTEQLAAALQKGTAPALATLLARIAARFNLTVSQKALVQAVPVLGAATGAAINVAFMDHFNRVARFHFGIRSLERKHGRDVVQEAYRGAAKRLRKS